MDDGTVGLSPLLEGGPGNAQALADLYPTDAGFPLRTHPLHNASLHLPWVPPRRLRGPRRSISSRSSFNSAVAVIRALPMVESASHADSSAEITTGTGEDLR
jgi:hypothetical protein